MFASFKPDLSLIYKTLVSGKQKAIVAFVVATVGTYVARHGWTLNMTLGQAVQALCVGVIAHVGVYFKANK